MFPADSHSHLIFRNLAIQEEPLLHETLSKCSHNRKAIEGASPIATKSTHEDPHLWVTAKVGTTPNSASQPYLHISVTWRVKTHTHTLAHMYVSCQGPTLGRLN